MDQIVVIIPLEGAENIRKIKKSLTIYDEGNKNFNSWQTLKPVNVENYLAVIKENKVPTSDKFFHILK